MLKYVEVDNIEIYGLRSLPSKNAINGKRETFLKMYIEEGTRLKIEKFPSNAIYTTTTRDRNPVDIITTNIDLSIIR